MVFLNLKGAVLSTFHLRSLFVFFSCVDAVVSYIYPRTYMRNTMAISKQFLKTKPVCKVTFSVPAKEANEVKVVGSFNEWNADATPLKKLKNGTFKGTVDLPKDQSYEFRYLVDGTYVNDEQADAYQWNDYAAADNGVLNL